MPYLNVIIFIRKDTGTNVCLNMIITVNTVSACAIHRSVLFMCKPQAIPQNFFTIILVPFNLYKPTYNSDVIVNSTIWLNRLLFLFNLFKV